MNKSIIFITATLLFLTGCAVGGTKQLVVIRGETTPEEVKNQLGKPSHEYISNGMTRMQYDGVIHNDYIGGWEKAVYDVYDCIDEEKTKCTRTKNTDSPGIVVVFQDDAFVTVEYYK